MRRATGKPTESGLTLIEMLIGILLAALLTAGLYYMMAGQTHTYGAQRGVLDAQANLWQAMEFMQREVRRAGYGLGGCGGRLTVFNGGLMTQETLVVRNAYNLRTSAADTSDSLQIVYMTGSSADQVSVRLTKWNGAASVIDVDSDANGQIRNGDFLVLSIPGSTGCTLMQATQNITPPPPSFRIRVNPGGSPYNPPGLGPPGYLPPGCCGTPGPGCCASAVITRLGASFSGRFFAIDKSRDPPRLVTWTGPADSEVVAAGIEDMQLAWACDANGSGALEEGTTAAARQTDEWAYNYLGVGVDTLPACGSAPIAALRITLIARTAGPVVGDLNGRRPGAEDNPGDAPAPAPSADLVATGGVGTYGRAMLTSVVKPRNIAGP